MICKMAFSAISGGMCLRLKQTSTAKFAAAYCHNIVIELQLQFGDGMGLRIFNGFSACAI